MGHGESRTKPSFTKLIYFFKIFEINKIK